MRGDVVHRIVACGLIPVIRAPSADIAMRAVDAIVAGGIDIVEVTLTVRGALPLVESLARRYDKGEVVIGAGTVVDAETARACILAGAAFVVSPIVDEPTIECCRSYGVPVLPGALTPTEIMRAVRAGADMVKVFPCGALGGASYIRSLLAPLPHLRLVPTGGVSVQNVGDFIRAGASAVGVGADLVNLDKLRDGHAEAIVERARQYAEAIRLAREPKGPA
jgi:2-dehydro-3-deoxyphosphogluconate aldolase / (4S)-4-hydroxy-2-oxoglutarate aldolase